MNRPTQPVWWSIISLLIANIVMAVILVWYVNHTTEQSERKWCEFLIPLDDAWSSVPPQSVLGRTVAASIHKLRVDFGC